MLTGSALKDRGPDKYDVPEFQGGEVKEADMHDHGPAAPDTPDTGPKLILVGNPNVGKSVFFRLLTGRYVVVSNYPGTTVEVARGSGRFSGQSGEVIDTPGANSLSPNSEDERVARDVVVGPGEKTVVQVADAKNLRRALLLTAQLAELGIPMVLALNMWDEAQDRGIEIDVARLEAELDVPVVPTVATERRGFRRLTASLADARPSKFVPRYGDAIEDAVSEVEELLPAGTAGGRGIALMLLANAPTLEAHMAARAEPGFRGTLDEIRRRLASNLRESAAFTIQRHRARHADEVVERVQAAPRGRAPATGLLRMLFFWLFGPAAFYAVGWKLASFVFYALSGEGLLSAIVGGEPRFAALGVAGSALATHGFGLLSMLLYSASMWRREYRGGGSAAAALARLSTHPVGGFFLLVFVLWVVYFVVGVVGAGECVDFVEGTVFGTFDEGEYGGLVNGPLSRGLASVIGRDNIVHAFLFDDRAGLVSTGLTYSVAIVFPIVTLFFLLFGVMEDSGYLPRLALLADRIFKRVGLSGKAVLPMVLGLGCGTMATMTTRVLETRKQRLIAILLLALAVPCSAQLGIITAVLAGISGTGAALYVLVLAAALFGVGWCAARVIPGEGADLLLEVPPFRLPRPVNVVVKTYHRVKWFMREAVPLFLLGTVCLFVIARIGLLGWIEAAARPVVTGLLGLPAAATIGFIMGFLRRDYGAVIIFQQFKQGTVGANQALVALIVITLFVPCLAHFFVCVKELGWRKALLMDALILVIAVLVGTLVRVLLVVTGIDVSLAA